MGTTTLRAPSLTSSKRAVSSGGERLMMKPSVVFSWAVPLGNADSSLQHYSEERRQRRQADARPGRGRRGLGGTAFPRQAPRGKRTSQQGRLRLSGTRRSGIRLLRRAGLLASLPGVAARLSRPAPEAYGQKPCRRATPSSRSDSDGRSNRDGACRNEGLHVDKVVGDHCCALERKRGCAGQLDRFAVARSVKASTLARSILDAL